MEVPPIPLDSAMSGCPPLDVQAASTDTSNTIALILWGILGVTWSILSYTYSFTTSIISRLFSFTYAILYYPFYILILSPLSWIFALVMIPVRVILAIFYEIEPLIFPFICLILTAIFIGGVIAIVAHYLTDATQSILSYLPPSSSPTRSKQHPSSSTSRRSSSSGQNSTATADEEAEEEASSFDSDDDPWASKAGPGTSSTSKTAKLLLTTPSSIKRNQKIIPGLLNETIHEEEDSDDSGISSG
ncbi:hypothetical protein QBC35DRAFT_458814 [Podospora australis]|uniref:Uncharacterized protein n=1 Tax=Podospora australis TaxID=1536484 RepID=A0AAN6X387_9PEZI|nr:hypothetical protein QBC35DRAFT_458814 [Podospora australis]